MNEHAPDAWTERIKAVGVIVDQLFRYLGPLLTALVLYYQSQAGKAVVEKAAEIKTELTAAKTATDATLHSIATKQDVLVVQGDAGNKSWLAFETKDPADKDAAAKAVVNAERLTENMPPVTPKP